MSGIFTRASASITHPTDRPGPRHLMRHLTQRPLVPVQVAGEFDMEGSTPDDGGGSSACLNNRGVNKPSMASTPTDKRRGAAGCGTRFPSACKERRVDAGPGPFVTASRQGRIEATVYPSSRGRSADRDLSERRRERELSARDGLMQGRHCPPRWRRRDDSPFRLWENTYVSRSNLARAYSDVLTATHSSDCKPTRTSSGAPTPGIDAGRRCGPSRTNLSTTAGAEERTGDGLRGPCSRPTRHRVDTNISLSFDHSFDCTILDGRGVKTLSTPRTMMLQ